MAKYDLKKPMRRAQFERYVKQLLDSEAFAELKKITDRSLKQNNYYHLIVSYYAIEFGYSKSYAERIFKEQVNPNIFVVEKMSKDGEMYKDTLSSAKVTMADLALSIERFHNHSAKGGLRLPHPEDLMYLREIMEAIEQNKEHL
jgi:3-hydroxyisobutyrate dehydrogenase-like beta-hydroxyacid dehydrogenase